MTTRELAGALRFGGSAPEPQPRVTGVEPDPRRPGALRVLVDGRLFATIPGDVSHGVRTGLVVDDAVAARLGGWADEEAAFRLATQALARRAWARADLRRRLLARGSTPAAVQAALARVEALGLLDDAAFAREYVESRARRGRGPSRLAAELGRMGVARDVVDRALAEHYPVDDGTAARRLAEQRAPLLRGEPPATRLRRLLGFLARRGFRGARVQAMVREVLQEADGRTGGRAD
ncbi:MAG: regulatory protein RecX [Gemmatimonadales bacterium]|nr:regulatory protein RecX [Gemmatimonadales bacterium]